MRFLFACLLFLAASPAMAQPNPPIPPEVIAAARRPVVMTLPGMDKVQVTKDIRYAPAAPAHIAMDVYRPPGLKSGERRPAVLFIHGDDDRNVDFSQTVGLVQLLRAHGVYHELTVFPDDVHESLIHGRWLEVWNHSTDFLNRFVRDKQTPPVMSSAGGKH